MNYNLSEKQVNEIIWKKLINLILIKNTCGHILIGNPAEIYFSIHNYTSLQNFTFCLLPKI
jgi:hypothetical protein